MLKKKILPLGLSLVVLLIVVAWIAHFHNDWLASVTPKWAIVQTPIGWLAKAAPPAAADDDDPDTTKLAIPVHVAPVATATFHHYVAGFGTIAPRPPWAGQMAGGASIAAPVAGVVSEVLVQIGQHVNRGDPLVQLDDRVAHAAEDQAVATLAEAQATLDSLKAQPRPEQLQISQLAVKKAQDAIDFYQKEYERQQQLATQQGTTTRNVEQAAQDLASARNDLAVAEKQIILLTPTPQDIATQTAKVHEAQAALAAATEQRKLLRIAAPIDATVMQVNANPGESVDTTKPLVDLVAMDRLMVDVDVPAEQLSFLAEGQSAFVVPDVQTTTQPSTSANGEAGFEGKVAFISPGVDPKNGTVQVGIDVAADPAIRPGMTVNVRIVTDTHKDKLAVPIQAVTTDENNDSVVSLVDGDMATHKTVHAGYQEGGLVEIDADGVKEGDLVVTAGAYKLPPSTRIKKLDN